MDIRILLEQKKELRLTNKELADISGVSPRTISKIFSGATKHPRISTMDALEHALLPDSLYGTASFLDDGMIRDPSLAYAVSSNQRHTIDEYYQLPSDIRVELIDGVFIKMDAPSVIHQDIVLEMGLSIKSYIKEKKGSCRVYISPCDVRLDNDDYTMLQPDILIVCDKTKIDGRRINGAPDFVAEVLSPSTRSLDCTKKLNKYMNVGVREYWTLDFDKNVITVYLFEDKEIKDMNYYHFDDRVPVGIYEDLLIDFSEFDIYQ